MAGIAAVVAGKRQEAFVEFGEAPGAEARGLRVRRVAGGEKVLQIGPEDVR
jgi:hypothetical protein